MSVAAYPCRGTRPSDQETPIINARSILHTFHRWVLRSRHLNAKIPQHDLVLRVTPADVVGRHLYKYREYEPGVAATLEEHVRPAEGDLCLDIGANIGWYSLLVSRLSGNAATVLAFEPDPDNYRLLEHNLRHNDVPLVRAFRLAVGETPGTLQLHRYGRGNTGRHSLLPLHEGETVDVEVVGLDRFLDTEGLGSTPIKLLKMDIEGYELPALRGAPRVLERTQWVLIEHSPAYMRQAGMVPGDLVQLLVDSGFAPFEPEAGPLVGIAADVLRNDPDQRNVLWRRTRAQPSP